MRNFTDVDDKINAEAQRRKQAGAAGTLEELIHERTEETIRWYHEDMEHCRMARSASGICVRRTSRAPPTISVR